MDSKVVAAVRSRKRSAEKELALAQATTAARKRDGMDLVVAWSVVGLFVVACSAVVYAMAAILMPIAFAIVVGIVLGRAADELARFGLPPMLGGLLLALFFVLGLSSLVNTLLGPITELAREAPKLAESVVERVLPFIERFEWGRIALARSVGADAFADVVVKNAGPILGAAAASVTPALIQTLIFLAALVLFLLGRVQLRSTIILAFPSRDGRLSAIRIMNAIEDGLTRYFSTASLIYLALGGFTMMIALVGGLRCRRSGAFRLRLEFHSLSRRHLHDAVAARRGPYDPRSAGRGARAGDRLLPHSSGHGEPRRPGDPGATL